MTAHPPPARRAVSALRAAARGGVLAAVLAAVLALPACAGGDPGGGDSADAAPRRTAADTAAGPAVDEEHNAADIAFVRAMVPRHRAAVEMADAVTERGGSPAVRALAERIAASQEPDVATMTGWLAAWGTDVPDGAWQDGADALGGARGPALDRAYLTAMVGQHEEAVELAGTELADGVHRPARELARAIVRTRTAEIGEMTALLTGD